MDEPDPATVYPKPAVVDPSPQPARRRRRWAEHELGELLGRAGPDDGPGQARPASSAPWEVAAIPSEADGGVVRLLLNGQDDPLPEVDPVPVPAPETDSGRARLADSIDRLPTEPAPHVTPADDPDPTPPVVWFWGDDDVYPGKLPGGAKPVVGRRRLGRR